MKNQTLTYGQLATKLESLGYTHERCEINGKSAQVFEHTTREGAMIILPDAPPNREVETPYMHKVLIILRTHGLIEEQNPLVT